MNLLQRLFQLRDFLWRILWGFKEEDDKNVLYLCYNEREVVRLTESNQPIYGNMASSSIQGNKPKAENRTRDMRIQLSGYVVSAEEKREMEKEYRGYYRFLQIPSHLLGDEDVAVTLNPYEELADIHKKPTQKEKNSRVILDSSLIVELKKYKTIKLLPIGNCADLCEEIRNLLKKCKFVNDNGDVTVVVVVKTTRVQSDAEMAMEQAKIGPGDGHNTILMMLHSIGGSKTIEDIQNVMYRCPTVYKTVHVPYKASW